MDDNALRALARVKLEAGKLPRQRELRVWAGPSFGDKPCALCDEVISRDDFEYEIQVVERGDLQPYRFHRRCHAIWQLERVG